MSARGTRAAAAARIAARRAIEAADAVTVRPWRGTPEAPAGPTPPSAAWWEERAEAAALARLALPTDPATWDAVQRRADAAAAARDALAVATGRAYGSPVRGYRSRRGYTWPGYSPVVAAPWSPGESERSSASRAVLTRKAGGAA